MTLSAAIQHAIHPRIDEDGVSWRLLRIASTQPPGSLVRFLDKATGGIVAEASEGEIIEVLEQTFRPNTLVCCVIPPVGDLS